MFGGISRAVMPSRPLAAGSANTSGPIQKETSACWKAEKRNDVPFCDHRFAH
jgi:hypothetical protein